MKTLLTVARAMQSEALSSLQFKLEGHTDRSGRADFNEILSQKRAQSTVEFLASRGVAKERLSAEGKGFRELIPGLDPNSPSHRRVTIKTLVQD
jgi:outer membrane protein OmpA-like peptidoglycan-associated protein